jgi:hypothetical protein
MALPEPATDSGVKSSVRRPADPAADFTLDHYREILAAITTSHRTFSFKDASALGKGILDTGRFVLMRHDVEISLTSALRIAKLDCEAGVRSTFFLLFSSEYNIFEPESAAIVSEILALGHDIGLHYDPSAYTAAGADPTIVARRQIDLMESYWQTRVYAMSCHLAMRAGRTLSLPGVLEAYAPLYFDQIKYLSDSTQRWREGVVTELLERYDQIQLLTHEYYWTEEGHSFDVELLRESVRRFNRMIARAESDIVRFKEGLRLRTLRDAEFRRHRARDT